MDKWFESYSCNRRHFLCFKQWRRSHIDWRDTYRKDNSDCVMPGFESNHLNTVNKIFFLFNLLLFSSRNWSFDHSDGRKSQRNSQSEETVKVTTIILSVMLNMFCQDRFLSTKFQLDADRKMGFDHKACECLRVSINAREDVWRWSVWSVTVRDSIAFVWARKHNWDAHTFYFKVKVYWKTKLLQR